jgi:hypothetical protein
VSCLAVLGVAGCLGEERHNRGGGDDDCDVAAD